MNTKLSNGQVRSIIKTDFYKEGIHPYSRCPAGQAADTWRRDALRICRSSLAAAPKPAPVPTGAFVVLNEPFLHKV